MEKDELLRIKRYWLILEAGDGQLYLLTRDERKDLKQLLEKWIKENYEGGETQE